MFKMDDETSRVVSIIAGGGALGLAFGIIRGVVNQKHGGWPGFIRGAFASVGAAILVALGIADLELTVTKQAAIIGVSAYVADDILLGLLTLGQMFGKDPVGFVRDIFSSIRGGKRNE